jgi:hypothetical protein
MSTSPENELDLEKLFLPAWAQEPSSAKLYANYEGGDDRPDRKGDRRGGRKPFRREGGGFGGGGFGGGGFGGDRPRGDRPRGDRPPGDRPRGDRPGGPRRPEGQRPFEKGRPGFNRGAPAERREPLPLPEINVNFLPEEMGVESLARQIKMTGRAYPLFDIARLVLERPERHLLAFSTKKKADGQVVQPLFLCALDDSLWLSEDEAVANVLKQHFGTFYQAERTATEPPKGKYTFVAQCGISGVILGPPNHHDYQNQLHKLHTQRFSRMPFEMFKSRVRIVREEEVVKKWIEEQSWKTEYTCLNVPEPLRLATRDDVEKHFRQVHKENIIKPVESHTLTGAAARSLRSADMQRLVRQSWEAQRRFPLQIATVLSQQFAGYGLQFFKVNKAVTHVSVARPHYLDLITTPVSEGVKRIVDFINATPKSTRRKLLEALAPTPVPTVIPVAPEPAPAPPAPVVAPEAAPAAPAEGAPAPAAAAPATPPAAVPAGPTPEQTAVISDLHWLVHQGHVIEFANGILETAKKPLPKPPKPAAKPAAPAEAVPAEAVPAEAAPVETAEISTLAETAAETPAAGEAAMPETAEAGPVEPAPVAETPVEPLPAPSAEAPAPVTEQSPPPPESQGQ